MTTDDGLHLLGTRPFHVHIAWVILGAGYVADHLFDSTFLLGAGFGITAVLLFGHMRANAPRYRWRVDDDSGDQRT